MKYSTVLLSLVAGAFAFPQDASSITSAPVSLASANLTPQQSCAVACDPADVNCQAACLGAAHPNSAQVVDTTKCAEKCDQGNGSPEDTKKFSDCVQSCINSFFPSSQTFSVGGAAPASAASNAASVTGSPGAAVSSVASRVSGTGSVATTGSGAASSSSPTGAANSNTVQIAGAGIAGLFMAIFAL